MVNNGPSRACQACKERHKKCDETRPTCIRCSKARRKCPGYDIKRERKFVNYSGETDHDLLYLRSAGSPDQLRTTGISDWSIIESHSEQMFFIDYCIVSSNQSVSRGYLSGLQALVASAGRKSEVAKAVTIIALAHQGKKVKSSAIIQRAQNLHSLLLRSFRLSILDRAKVTSVESMITAALLGLYEVITSTEIHQDAHIAHARGISAILNSRYSPFDLACGGKLFLVTCPLPLEEMEFKSSNSPILRSHARSDVQLRARYSILCSPLINHSKEILDTLCVETELLFQRARSVLAGEATSDQIFDLMVDTEKIKASYDAWPGGLSEEWRPRCIGVIPSKQDDVKPPVGFWPCEVFVYHDAYVASIWNSFRKISLMMLNIVMECRQRLHNPPQHLDTIYRESQVFIDGIVSSLLFLLADNPQECLETMTAGAQSFTPGKPVSGLLVIHTLWVLSTLQMVDAKLKAYVKDCMLWIGETMGIGQATILSKCTNLDLYDYVTEAHVVIWAGMLI